MVVIACITVIYHLDTVAITNAHIRRVLPSLVTKFFYKYIVSLTFSIAHIKELKQN